MPPLVPKDKIGHHSEAKTKRLHWAGSFLPIYADKDYVDFKSAVADKECPYPCKSV